MRINIKITDQVKKKRERSWTVMQKNRGRRQRSEREQPDFVTKQKLHHNWDCAGYPFSWRLRVEPFPRGGSNEITVDVGDYTTPNHFKNLLCIFIYMQPSCTHTYQRLIQFECHLHKSIHILISLTAQNRTSTILFCNLKFLLSL